MVMVIYQTLNEIKKLMNSVSPLIFFLHSVREWHVYKDSKMGCFLPSSQQIFRLKRHCQNTWLGMKVLCRFAVSQICWRMCALMAIAQSLVPGCRSGTPRVSGWSKGGLCSPFVPDRSDSRRCHRQNAGLGICHGAGGEFGGLLSHPHAARHVSSSAVALSSVCNAYSFFLCCTGTHLPSLTHLLGLL